LFIQHDILFCSPNEGNPQEFYQQLYHTIINLQTNPLVEQSQSQ